MVDPDQAIKDLRQAILDGDTERADQVRQDLGDWEKQGGFAPNISWHEAMSNATEAATGTVDVARVHAWIAIADAVQRRSVTARWGEGRNFND